LSEEGKRKKNTSGRKKRDLGHFNDAGEEEALFLETINAPIRGKGRVFFKIFVRRSSKNIVDLLKKAEKGKKRPAFPES